MIKISALNKEEKGEARSDEEVTKEALEQIALQQYAKALELQRNGNRADATQLLKDLLDTELLDEVKKPQPGEKITGPLLNLKYLCYKNLGSMLSASGDVAGAIDSFGAASDIDDTDVTLWHRLGQAGINAKRYELALLAFQRGTERNPKHWPCLDKIVTLLLGLDYKEECISTIYETLQLDPSYLRGLVYRKYIYTTYPYVKEFLEYLNPMYKWNENDDEQYDNNRAQKLLKEAEEIHNTYIEQQKAGQLKNFLSILNLQKPITKLSWEAVGDSLVSMHHYMTEKHISHACHLNIAMDMQNKEETLEFYETKEQGDNERSQENHDRLKSESITERITDNESNEILENDKTVATNFDKNERKSEEENDKEDIGNIESVENATEPIKKTRVRRRGSALSFLQQWEWCNKRRSGRKKITNTSDNIYDTLRRLVPNGLGPEEVQTKEKETNTVSETITKEQKVINEKDQYFNSEQEHKDVKQFIIKYADGKCDIIDIIQNYLSQLARKWKLKWPGSLVKIFVEAGKCYSTHIDVPSCTNENHEELVDFTMVNLLFEEFCVNDKLNKSSAEKHPLNVIEQIGMTINSKPHIFTDILEITLRYLWVKLHINILNKAEDQAIDCLYQLCYEFEALNEHQDLYHLYMINFTFKPIINRDEISAYTRFLERNRRLSTVMQLYEQGLYNDVLSIVIDSFEHCKNMDKKQEEEVSLDLSAQLSLILDSLWALDKIDCCFKWSLICLHEALKNFFRYTSGSPDYEKWSLSVVKVLYCMEQILTTEGLSCLEAVTQRELSQGLEDLIRIIGHQVETNAAEMPFGTVVSWIIIHFILQREEDQGRGRIVSDNDNEADNDIPNPLMVLFIAHEQLGNRGWCCNSEGKLLYFILDTVVPRLRSPYLSKYLEQVCPYMEQCVYCLFGHPAKKNKLKYLVDHNVTPYTMDWKRAQQVYEIYRPPILPALEGKNTALTADTEQLFHRILELLPPELNPSKYLPDVKKYIKGMEKKLPAVPPLLPYKMKDIYFLLGDYYFKREDLNLGIKYNMLDIVLNNSRLESWAEISLAKASSQEKILKFDKNIKNAKEFLTTTKSIIRCFKRSLEIDPTHCNLWIEYGMFVYTVHSFCSRLLKQNSESLSMEDFESLEKQKETMLNTTYECFMAVLGDHNKRDSSEKATEVDIWLPYYMLGKVAEKRNKPPSEYLTYYMQGVKSLRETDATYPLKINYSTPTHLCIEVLELHYRLHASILKYIEQHENKPIPISIGKVFSKSIEDWKNGPFTRKTKKEMEIDLKSKALVYPANIYKRSISDGGEEDNPEAKMMKLESAAAKVKRSASYDTERKNKEPVKNGKSEDNTTPSYQICPTDSIVAKVKTPPTKPVLKSIPEINELFENPEIPKKNKHKTKGNSEKKDDNSSSSSSSSSSGSSTSESSSDSSNSSKNSDVSSKLTNDKPLPEDEIASIISACLDALEDCASRFAPHYKAIYRLAHYHFYYKKGKDIERCRDLMLSTFTSRSGQKLGGLFSERKPTNFFNNIWKIPIDEVDRADSFAFHMSRSVQLTMEILKEIDDHKTLLDLSLLLQRIPDLDKKYLRDADREELAQQACSLCVQSLKGQLLKFSQQPDLQSSDIEKQALKSLMMDIYRAYQRAQKQPNSKQFTNLLIEAYKLVTPTPISENMNLVDLSMKYCQALRQTLMQQATQASLDKSQNAQKKQSAKVSTEVTKTSNITTTQSRLEPKVQSIPTSSSQLKMSAQEMVTAAFQSFLPVMSESGLSQAAATLSYINSISALAGLPPQNSIHSSFQNSFQNEFYRQFLAQTLSSINLPPPPPPKKQKRASKHIPRTPTKLTQVKANKSFGAIPMPISKPPTSVGNLQKSLSLPSMGTVLPTLPPSMSANLASFSGSSMSSSSLKTPTQAHMSSPSTSSAAISLLSAPNPHQKICPGKTLQEKLAEKQKNLPPVTKVTPDINKSISKLPSSLTITKSSRSKLKAPRQDPQKPLKSNNETSNVKPVLSEEIIILDDD